MFSEKEAKAITDKILSYVTASDATVAVSGDKLSHLRFAHNSFLTSGERHQPVGQRDRLDRRQARHFIDQRPGRCQPESNDRAG